MGLIGDRNGNTFFAFYVGVFDIYFIFGDIFKPAGDFVRFLFYAEFSLTYTRGTPLFDGDFEGGFTLKNGVFLGFFYESG